MPHEEGPAEGPAPAKRAHPRRSRRGGRGRRRPARSPGDPETTTPEGVEAPRETSAEDTAIESPQSASRSLPEEIEPSPAPEDRVEEQPEPIVEQRPLRDDRRPQKSFTPAAPAAVAEAIEEVNQIIASLKQALEQMDEVLETLELAEVQKTADEREIQTLRQSLRQLDRRGPRERQEPSRQERDTHEHQRNPEPRRREDRHSSGARPDRPD
jgi:hypothetical protein